ncbi:MAG: hypothetical protein ACI3ZD_11975, partial [Prevotella sp.]
IEKVNFNVSYGLRVTLPLHSFGIYFGMNFGIGIFFQINILRLTAGETPTHPEAVHVLFRHKTPLMPKFFADYL